VLDHAIEYKLTNNKELTEPDIQKMFLHVEFGEKSVPLIDSLLYIDFTSGDLQPELFTDADQLSFFEFCEKTGIESVDISEVSEYYLMNKKHNFSENEKKAINYAHILCLQRKVLMILPVLYKWIDENVKKVISVQKKVDILNSVGDRLIGYLDFVIENHKNEVILIDLKTSSNPSAYYPDGCVEKSQQLGIYAQEVGAKKAAYLVVDKKIRKKKPRIRLKYIEGVITDTQLDTIFQQLDRATQGIKSGDFSKNEQNCFAYGKCEYYDLCKHGNTEGLVKYDNK
jgi:hypothetical protein